MPDVLLGSLSALGGSMLMFVFQEISKTRERRRTDEERRSSELINAVAALAEILLEYRHLQLARHRARLKDEAEESSHAVRRRDARARAWAGYFRATLLGMDEHMSTATEQILGDVRILAECTDHGELDRRGELIRDAIYELVRRASPADRATLSR